jgi:hypothetical protein
MRSKCDTHGRHTGKCDTRASASTGFRSSFGHGFGTITPHVYRKVSHDLSETGSVYGQHTSILPARHSPAISTITRIGVGALSIDETAIDMHVQQINVVAVHLKV